MLKNTEKEIPLEIAKATMKAHKLRNIMACLAIALTTILITVICNTGISTIRAIITESHMNPGPGTEGRGIYGNVKILKKVQKQPEIAWADIARHCTMETPRNKEFSGLDINFLAVSDTYYKHHYIDLLTGTYPENAKEILMSSRLAQKIGRNLTPGQVITLNVIIQQNGKDVELPMNVTIVGFYQDPLDIENYEELYTTQDFPDLYNPELHDNDSKIYPKFITSSKNFQDDLSKLSEKVQATGIFYAAQADTKEEQKNSILFLLIIIASGYFLIYNIFYISIVNNIRFIGNMKIIGMTRGQIHTMLRWQIWRLGIIGITIGIVIGNGCNLLVISFLKHSQVSYARYYETWISFPLATLIAIIFSSITVWISSRSALLLARKISPIEASKFHSSSKRKTIFAIISFTFSGILFSGIFSTFTGYNVDYQVKRMHQSDYKIYQYHAGQIMKKPYQPMSKTLVERICALDFVKESYIYHKAHDLNETPSSDGIYSESITKIRLEGRFFKLIKQELLKLGGFYTEKNIKEFCNKGEDFSTGVLGMEPKAWELEMQNLDIYDGTINLEQFASGDYFVYRPYANKDTYIKNGLKSGEEITLSFYDSSQKKYITKTLKVMAIIGIKPDNYAGNIDATTQFILPNSLFQEIYGDSSDQMVSNIQLNTVGKNWRKEQDTIKQLIAEQFNPQIMLGSRYEYHMKQEMTKIQQVAMAFLAGFVIGLIGIANIINTVITNVLSRKIEFATLQSIGMTKRQMTGSIQFDGSKMILVSFFIILPSGYYATKILTKIITGNTKFVLSAYSLSCMLILLAGVLSLIVVAHILTKTLNKKTMVTRLREAE